MEIEVKYGERFTIKTEIIVGRLWKQEVIDDLTNTQNAIEENIIKQCRIVWNIKKCNKRNQELKYYR